MGRLHLHRTARCALSFVLLGLASSGAAAQTALVGATAVVGDGTQIADAVIVVEENRIVCIGTEATCPIPAGADQMDLSGQFVTPGLVDAHVHFSQTGWIDGRPDGLSAPDIYPYLETSRSLRADPGRWHRSYLCSGITAVFDVGGHPWTTDLPAAAEDSPDAAHVRAAGPLITHATRTALMADEDHYTFLPMDTPEEVEASVAKLVDMGSSAVKVWYLRPPEARRDELDARLLQVGAAAQLAGLDLIVHATSLREAKMALRAGAKLLVHSVEDTFVDDEFLTLLMGNDAVYAPTLNVGGFWSRAMASIALDTPYTIDDTNGCVDPGSVDKIEGTEALQALLSPAQRSTEGIFRRLERNGRTGFVMAENIRRVFEAGGTVATATDAGNPLTLHGPSIYNEMEAMQAAGIDARDVIQMSTRNGAVAMNRLDDFGTLEAGKIADLIILPEDPTADVRAFRSLTHVMRAGLLRTQRELAWRRPAS
ncbi:MAG: amidohydrolase family protein [Longimicrobiales bacterium]